MVPICQSFSLKGVMRFSGLIGEVAIRPSGGTGEFAASQLRPGSTGTTGVEAGNGKMNFIQ